jgi:predicted Zn finger-like uncharacterized protein
MRLVCPNCEAKYEVPEDAIPETGRDVQCANCGHAWYQMRPRAGGAEPAVPPVVPPAAVEESVPEPAPVIEPEPEPAAEVVAEVVAEVPVVAEDVVAEVASEPSVAAEEVAPETVEAAAEESAAVVEAAVETVAEAEAPAVEPEVAAAVSETVEGAEAEEVSEDGQAEVGAPVLGAAAAPAAYAVDESVLAILREEAEREARARRAEAAKPLETQTDLGIEAAIPAAVKAPMPAVPAAVDTESEDKLAARRTRLPDVEEINSTLRPAEAAAEESEGADPLPVVAERRSSFRSGFLLVLTVAILGSAIYGAADSLAEAVPALAGPLKAYVGFVDSLRLHLDGLMQSATVAINGD